MYYKRNIYIQNMQFSKLNKINIILTKKKCYKKQFRRQKLKTNKKLLQIMQIKENDVSH